MELTRIRERTTSKYMMGTIQTFGINDDYYISEIMEFKYRGVPVKYREIYEMDKTTLRCYRVTQVGFDWDKIYITGSNNLIPNEKNYREYIDNYINRFKSFINEIKIEKTLHDAFVEKYPNRDSSKLYDDLFETGIRFLTGSTTFNLIQKKQILRELIECGLSLENAIVFWNDVR